MLDYNYHVSDYSVTKLPQIVVSTLYIKFQFRYLKAFKIKLKIYVMFSKLHFMQKFSFIQQLNKPGSLIIIFCTNFSLMDWKNELKKYISHYCWVLINILMNNYIKILIRLNYLVKHFKWKFLILKRSQRKTNNNNNKNSHIF